MMTKIKDDLKNFSKFRGAASNDQTNLDAMLLSRMQGKTVKKNEYQVSKKNHVLLDLFRAKSSKGRRQEDETKRSEVIRTKLTKGGLRATLSRRYKGAIAEKVVSAIPGFHVAQDIDDYIAIIEKLLNDETEERLMKIAFNVYDFNKDKLICELDTYSSMQNFQDDDEVFVGAFSFDLCLIGEALDKKRRRAGVKDYDQYSTMQNIQRKLKAKGVSLDPSVIINISDQAHDKGDDFNLSDDEDEYMLDREDTRETNLKSSKSLRRMKSMKSRK